MSKYIFFSEKPKFVRSPQDILVEENEDVEFSCQATGDPSPTIIWKREEEPIPQGRYVETFIFSSNFQPWQSSVTISF